MPFKSCDEEHKHYFRGEISFVGVWGEYLSDEDIKNISENCGNVKNMKKIQNDKTVLFSNFKTRTLYKVYDDSDNGNHVILYDEYGIVRLEFVFDYKTPHGYLGFGYQKRNYTK